MAKFVAKDYSVTLASNDLSSSIAAVTLTQSAADVETTAFGDNSVTRIGGLKDGELTLEFHQDFGTGSVDEILQPLLGTVATVRLRPTSAAVGVDNPQLDFSVLVAEYSPYDSSIGDLATFSISLPISGDVTRTTA